MSVSGIDLGNLNLLIAQTSKGGVDVILNESSNRNTAHAISIQGKQRYFGDDAAAQARSNIKNTIYNTKLLVGRQFDDASTQKEIARLPFTCTKMSYGGVGIVVNYNDEDITIPAEHFLAMMINKAKEISAYANNGVSLADAVLAVPHWFTNSQRKAIHAACEIAELHTLAITNESNAIALGFGIFKSARKLFHETEPTYVMFIDIGYTGLSVTIVDFIQENMKVLSTVCSQEVSGRAFDDVIIQYLIEVFKKKTGNDVSNNKKAILKLQSAAEKAKKFLSPAGVTEANVSVECIYEDHDLNCILSRADFEERSAHIVEQLRAPVEKALAEAGITKQQLKEAEIIGGSTRINIVKRVLGEILELDPNTVNYGLKTTMNADEAICRGAALQCAMLSSRMKVKPFKIIDRQAHGVNATFEIAGEGLTTMALYSRNAELPHKPRRMVFSNKTSDFTITLSYDPKDNALPQGESLFIAKYTIHVPANPTGADIRVTFNIDRFGVIVLQSAQLMEPLPEEESKESKEESKETEKFKPVDLAFTAEDNVITKEFIKASIELEAHMANEDRIIVETADKRNELESYIYSMRDRLVGELNKFSTDAEKSALKSLMDTTENWLYEDGFDSTKSEYTAKLAELKKISDPIEFRFHNKSAFPVEIENFKKQIEFVNKFAGNYNQETHGHITDEERDSLRNATKQANEWIYDMQAKQGALPDTSDPVLTTAVIQARRQQLHNFAQPIMTKPKPKPAPTPAPEPTPATEESKAEESKAEESKAEESKAEESKSEPMDESA